MSSNPAPTPQTYLLGEGRVPIHNDYWWLLRDINGIYFHSHVFLLEPLEGSLHVGSEGECYSHLILSGAASCIKPCAMCMVVLEPHTTLTDPQVGLPHQLTFSRPSFVTWPPNLQGVPLPEEFGSNMGTPNHPFVDGIFQEINHPAIGRSPWLWNFPYGHNLSWKCYIRVSQASPAPSKLPANWGLTHDKAINSCQGVFITHFKDKHGQT